MPGPFFNEATTYGMRRKPSEHKSLAELTPFASEVNFREKIYEASLANRGRRRWSFREATTYACLWPSAKACRN